LRCLTGGIPPKISFNTCRIGNKVRDDGEREMIGASRSFSTLHYPFAQSALPPPGLVPGHFIPISDRLIAVSNRLIRSQNDKKEGAARLSLSLPFGQHYGAMRPLDIFCCLRLTCPMLLIRQLSVGAGFPVADRSVSGNPAIPVNKGCEKKDAWGPLAGVHSVRTLGGS
jgi:hypothetical protein